MSGFVLGVVGSRGFSDYTLLSIVLDKFAARRGISLIVSGGARGADSLAERYAVEHSIYTLIHKPQWDKHGKAAGFIRNADIVRDAQVIVAFYAPGPLSAGTTNTVKQAIDAGKWVLAIHEGHLREWNHPAPEA